MNLVTKRITKRFILYHVMNNFVIELKIILELLENFSNIFVRLIQKVFNVYVSLFSLKDNKRLKDEQ